MCPAHLDIHSSKRVVWIASTAARSAAGALPGLEGAGRVAAELWLGRELGHLSTHHKLSIFSGSEVCSELHGFKLQRSFEQ